MPVLPPTSNEEISNFVNFGCSRRRGFDGMSLIDFRLEYFSFFKKQVQNYKFKDEIKYQKLFLFLEGSKYFNISSL